MMVVSFTECLQVGIKGSADLREVAGEVTYEYGNGERATFKFERTPGEYSVTGVPGSVSTEISRCNPLIGLLTRPNS